MDKHPIRNCEINVYRRVEGTKGYEFTARFDNGKAFPIIFGGTTAEQARQRAEDFRADVIRQHEEAYAARQEALRKARAARAKKEAA